MLPENNVTLVQKKKKNSPNRLILIFILKINIKILINLN